MKLLDILRKKKEGREGDNLDTLAENMIKKVDEITEESAPMNEIVSSVSENARSSMYVFHRTENSVYATITLYFSKDANTVKIFQEHKKFKQYPIIDCQVSNFGKYDHTFKGNRNLSDVEIDMHEVEFRKFMAARYGFKLVSSRVLKNGNRKRKDNKDAETAWLETIINSQTGPQTGRK